MGAAVRKRFSSRYKVEFVDSLPKTISSKDHRPAFASDGDYFSKPSLDDMVEEIYAVMHEKNPALYPSL